jgi:hypothetical protein
MGSNPKVEMHEIPLLLPEGATLLRAEYGDRGRYYPTEVVVLTFDNGQTLTFTPRIDGGIDPDLEWEWGTDGNA